jgi:D-alanyl-D-alanine carboxypeptidase/D-alanyl-D-alanine-endopeptidase (penicillin-binding protein 4)
MRAALIACLLAGFCQAAQAQLPDPVARQLAAHKLPQDALSLLVLRGDAVLAAHQAERLVQPASTIKLLTTLVSLEQLGPGFRGRTELRTTGLQEQDVLKGDLFLRGGADVDLDTAALTHMLRALRYQGIRRIEGRLVLDRQLFRPARTDLDVAPFDESPEAYYNVIPDALLVNKNMLQLDLRADARQLRVSALPALDRVSVESDMTLVHADCSRWEDGWKLPSVTRAADGSIRVALRGTFPRNCVRTYSINVLERNDYVDRLVRRIWWELGGELAGDTVEAMTPQDARLLAEHVSRALPEILRDTNKPSDNALARTLLLSLGSLEADPSGSRPLAVAAEESSLGRAELNVRGWLRRQGIDDTGLVLDNGSGLSRTERITAWQMGRLLQAGLRSQWAPEFVSSLPIAGTDGTLSRRYRDSPAFQRARLKTGALRNVVALAGYVQDAYGQPCVLVAIVNSEQAGQGRGRAVVDAAVEWVAGLRE